MAASSIGIKIADGTYYKVLDESARVRKRVILTTVKDNQTGAQIDLYRGNGSGLGGAKYIGSLVIDEIEPGPKGKPEIELIVGIDDSGNLEAQASDAATGEKQTLSVALDSIPEGGVMDAPDFSLDEELEPDLGVSPAEESGLTGETYTEELSQVTEELGRIRRRRILQYAGLSLFAVVVIVLIVLLIVKINNRPTQTAPVASAPAAKTVPAPAAPAATAQKPAPEAQKPAASGAPAPAAPVATAPATPRQGGVSYYIRWGDTLWDLSMSFYRTPWLYGKIAKANNIKNPDLIFAHTEIYIPER